MKWLVIMTFIWSAAAANIVWGTNWRKMFSNSALIVVTLRQQAAKALGARPDEQP